MTTRILALLALILLCGCGGTAVNAPLDNAQSLKQSAQAELAALTPPAQVDAATWAELTAALLASIEEAQSSPALRQTSGDPGTDMPGPFFSERPYVEHSEHIITWYNLFPGDYDQNLEVNAADLVQLGIHLGKQGAGNPPRFAHGTVEFVVDGNGDGVINISDVTTIGEHFREVLLHYNLYALEELKDGFPYYGEVPEFEPLLTVPGSAVLGDKNAQRYYEVELPADLQSFYWIAPVTSRGHGLSSSPALAGALGSHDTTRAPYWREHSVDLEYAAAANEISWNSVLAGDGDRNGVITIADLTPIGTFFNSAPPYERDFGDFISYSDPDSNRDGTVDFRDALAIGAFLGQLGGEYNLYYSANSADVPLNPWADSTIAPLENVEFLRMEPPLRGVFSLDFTPASGGFFWLRAVVDGDEGPVSEIITVP